MSILEPNNLDYLQLTSSSINSSSFHFINGIINKRHMQVIVIQKKLVLKELPYAINKNYK